MGGEIISGIIGAIVAVVGMIYTYRRGRLSGRDAQHVRFEKFYERLLDLPDADTRFFFNPQIKRPLSAHQKALLVWYFTICEGAWLQMKHSLVDHSSASNFIQSLSAKFGHLAEAESLLKAEGFDLDFINSLAFQSGAKPSSRKEETADAPN